MTNVRKLATLHRLTKETQLQLFTCPPYFIIPCHDIPSKQLLQVVASPSSSHGITTNSYSNTPKPVALPPNRSHLHGRIWHYSQMPQDHPQVLWNHPQKLCLTQKNYDITSKCSIIPRCYGISSKCHSIIHRFCGITSKCHGITQFAPALPPKRDHCHRRSWHHPYMTWHEPQMASTSKTVVVSGFWGCHQGFHSDVPQSELALLTE